MLAVRGKLTEDPDTLMQSLRWIAARQVLQVGRLLGTQLTAGVWIQVMRCCVDCRVQTPMKQCNTELVPVFDRCSSCQCVL